MKFSAPAPRNLGLLTCCALASALSGPAQALQAGDLMFTAFNADQDGWAMVATTTLAANTQVFFTDNEWNGRGAFNTGEGYLQWNSGPKAIAAGTVLRFNQVDNAQLLAASLGTLSRVRVNGSSALNLNQLGDTLYAYQGRSVAEPSVFVSAISTSGFADAGGGLNGTGLAAGLNAVAVALGADLAEVNAARAGQTRAQLLQTLVAPQNWSIQEGGDYRLVMPDLRVFEVTPVPEPATALLGLVGVGLLLINRRRDPS